MTNKNNYSRIVIVNTEETVETLETVRKTKERGVNMLNFWECSIVMIVRMLQISKYLIIAIAIALLLQLIVYQMSNKKINLYKKFNRFMNNLINANI